MQAFFILMAVITGMLLLITLIFGAAAVDAELQQEAESRKAAAVVRAMPGAKLTIAEYNRLICGERARRRWRR